MAVSKKTKADLLAKITGDLAEKTTAEMANIEPEKILNYEKNENKKEPVKKVLVRMPFYLPSENLKTALKQLALDEKTSVNQLVLEGLKTVLKKRGKNINDYLD